MSDVDLHSPSFSALGRRASPPTIARLMTMALETPGLLSLAAGFTDNATLPFTAVADAAAKLVAGAGDPEYLQYGMNQGRPALRRALAKRFCRQEPGQEADDVARRMVITNGSQQALYLAAQVLCDPGDIVLVDRPSYFVFLEMLQGLGVQAKSIPTDETGGVDHAAFGQLLDHLKTTGEVERLRAIYFVSYFSNPSARSLGTQEKIGMAEALAKRGLIVPVLEDAAYRELYYEEELTVPSVFALRAWDRFPKLYLSTLTKPFATGLKVGYAVCSDDAWLKKILHVKGHHDFGTANFNQALFELVLCDGGFDRQLTRVRTVYAQKMRALHETLCAEGLGELGWTWDMPRGGLYLWLKAPPTLDTRLEGEFCRRCVANGVVYVPGDLCFGNDAPTHFARLSFGVLTPENLRLAAQRFVATARQFA